MIDEFALATEDMGEALLLGDEWWCQVPEPLPVTVTTVKAIKGSDL
jgi:hypothetical protein